jgi:hypothetical protein
MFWITSTCRWLTSFASRFVSSQRGVWCARAGRIGEGRIHYAEAIEATKGVSDASLRQLAILNFAREEIIAGQRLPDSVVALKIDARSVTMQILKKKVFQLIADSISAE